MEIFRVTLDFHGRFVSLDSIHAPDPPTLVGTVRACVVDQYFFSLASSWSRSAGGLVETRLGAPRVAA